MTGLPNDWGELTPEQRELLALLLEEEGISLGTSSIRPRDRALDPPPLSFAQQRLWFLDQLEPASAMYNMPAAARLSGQLNLAHLQRAVDEIVARHETLRTVFARSNDGDPVQIIAERLPLPIETRDLSALSPQAREEEIVRLAREEVQRPFDLASGPLLRMTVLVLSEREHVLLLNMHHIVTDGWSIGVFLKELAVRYSAAVTGAPALLPDLAIQYGDYAVWQRDFLQGAVLEEQLSYWRATLDGAAPVLELPFDRPRPAVQTYNGAATDFLVPADVRDALAGLVQAEGATLFMGLLAAFQVLLYHYSHQSDISIGTPIANRTRRELEDLIGFFANTLVIRGDLSGNLTYRDLLRRTLERTLAAYEHQEAPFERVVEAVQPERTLSYAPLFQVMFVLQNVPQQAWELPGIVLSPLRFPSITAKFDLTLNMTEQPNGIGSSIEYNTDLFDATTIHRFIGHFQHLLTVIARDPDVHIDLVPLLSHEERLLLLEEVNATTTDAKLDLCIHHLFEAQVERTPDAVALVFEQEQLTYAHLNRRADQLARRLQDLGVGPEVLVGICMERSPEMVIAMMAVLKAGGAYVPLDPRYPGERIEYMLADSDAPVLVTQTHLIEELSSHFATLPLTIVDVDEFWQTTGDLGESQFAQPGRAAVRTTPHQRTYPMCCSPPVRPVAQRALPSSIAVPSP